MALRRSCIVVLLSFASVFAGCASQNSTLPAGWHAGADTTRRGIKDGAAISNVAGIAIDVGGGAPAPGWAPDTDYQGGTTSTARSAVDTSAAINPAPADVYASQRYGRTFSYVIPGLTPNAPYTVRLHLAETYFAAAGKRIFNASINGTPALTNFDIFANAGGAGIALIVPFVTTSTAAGTITIAFTSSVNNASVAAIEIISPTAKVSGGYPVYSWSFTGNSPFHHTVAQLMAAGAIVRPSDVAAHYWAQGLEQMQPGSETGGVGPLYTASSGDPAYQFSCPTYGTCNASGLTVHMPAGAAPETGSDHHIASFDPVYLHGEVDGWGGAGQACNLTPADPGTENCSWGGFYPFSGNGLATDSSSANAGGYALGIMQFTAQELLQGHIDHALGIQQSCLDDGGVYPAIVGRGTDSKCPSNLEPNARYGDLIHLKSSVNVASLGASPYCAVILQALQTYGAYTSDNNGRWGIALGIEYMSNYTGINPWYQTIFPSIVAGGDGSGSGSKVQYPSCLNRIPAADIEVIEISSNVPAF